MSSRLAARAAGWLRERGQITVSAPITYPVKQVEAQVAWQANGGLGMISAGFGGDRPQAAGSALAMLADGERLSRLWRYVFVQMPDDYTSVLRHAGVPAAARMWASAPRSTGDIRVDAAFAAMAEYLARRDGREVRSWARLPGREAWPWWFVTGLPGLHLRALVESPSSFRRRGVFITSGALDRA